LIVVDMDATASSIWKACWSAERRVTVWERGQGVVGVGGGCGWVTW
jgi:hypothetical protein